MKRFTVMKVHSDFLSRYALTLIGLYRMKGRPDPIWMCPRYIRISNSRDELETRAAELNNLIPEQKRLPMTLTTAYVSDFRTTQ